MKYIDNLVKNMHKFATEMRELKLLPIEFMTLNADIKNEEHLGEQVKVSGTVTSVIKLGELSGYELTDKNGDKIGVSIKKLPQEGDRVTAKGTLMKEILIGYYILIKE